MCGDLGKLIVAKGFKKLPKVQKTPDLVTLLGAANQSILFHFSAWCCHAILIFVNDNWLQFISI